MLAVAATALFVLGLGILAALLGILGRHAIPRAPYLFHIVLFTPMILSSFSCFALAWMALTGTPSVFGVDALGHLTIYFAAQSVTYWTLNAYAIYHYFRTRRRSSG